MTIKNMPHVTCEQVLALREAAIKLEEQNRQLKCRVERLESVLKIVDSCERKNICLTDMFLKVRTAMEGVK